MDDIVVIESKDYAQVVFDDIKENYAENQPIECCYSLNELLKADSSDWIGIFKVGFNTTKEFACKENISLDGITDNKGKLIFQGEKVPKDDGEFYQFVYVSQSKQVRGASIPFQFKKARLSDYIEIEEQEAIIYKSKESAINDTLSEIKSRCNHLTEANDTYEKLIKENEDLISCLKEEVSNVKLRCLRLTIDNEKLNSTMKSKAENLKNLAETIGTLTTENNKLQNKFESLTSENKNLFESLQARIDQIEQLKTELESVKMDQIIKLEEQVNERVQELTKIKNDLKHNEAIVLEQTHTIETILNERDNLNNLIHKLSQEKNELACNQENLSQELNMSRDKLMAAEQCKEMLRAQLIVLTDDLNEANLKLKEQTTLIADFKEKESQFELEKKTLAQKLEQQKLDYEMKLEQTNGSYFALKLAHTHLETKLKQLETSKVNTDKEVNLLKIDLDKLREENDDLKERIKAGAKEYSKLFEKYRIVKNQQFNYDMNVYHDLNGGIHNLRNVYSENNRRFSTKYESSPINESDSAIQARASSSSNDFENTLLNALLGSPFYNNWRNEINQMNTSLNNKEMTWSSPSQSVAMSSIPNKATVVKRPSENQSDDGLMMNANNKATSELMSEKETMPSGRSSLSEENVFALGASSTPLHASQKHLLRLDIKNKTPAEVTTPAEQHQHQHQSGTCDKCNFIFPSNSDVKDIEKHYELHYGPQCPICFQKFIKGFPQSDFESHVHNHFSN